MPIAFSCPHCGKHTTVADQFAGQSGPCAACGKTITIPASAAGGTYGPPSRSSGGGSGVLIGMVVALTAIGLAVVVCGGVGWFALRSGMQRARIAAGNAGSANNMKQILLAMHMYHDVYRELPPAIVKDADGKPLYSGMVLLLPYLEQEKLYRQYNLSKPWNAPENQALSMIDIPTFKNPSAPQALGGKIDYQFVGGPQSLLDAGGKITLVNCTDGTSNTMILVEVRNSNRCWAEPSVWTPNQPLDSDNPDRVNVGMADGSVHAIPKTTPQQQLLLLANPKDGNPVSLPQ